MSQILERQTVQPRDYPTSKSLAGLHPEIVRQWDWSLNQPLRPDRIAPYSKVRVHWQCPVSIEHKWVASVAGRLLSKGPGCPFCARKRAGATTSLAFLFPDIAAQWDLTQNGSLTPADVGPKSDRKIHWKCPVAVDHTWISAIGSRTQGGTGHKQAGCPFCSGWKPSITNSVASAFPESALFWDYEKNGDLTPDQAAGGSMRTVYWKCDRGPDHQWSGQICNRTRRGGYGCPFCSNQRVSVTNSFVALYPEIAEQWDDELNGDRTPNTVVATSTLRVYWKCPVSKDHRWLAKCRDRVKFPSCPFCMNHLSSITNSLASLVPSIASQWDFQKNGTLTPDKVVAKSRKRAHWICSVSSDHKWSARIDTRTTMGTGCPHCARVNQSDLNKRRMLSGAVFNSRLEMETAKPMLLAFGFEHQSISREAHRFDFGDAARNLVVEINGCYWHDHRSLKPTCPTKVVSSLASGKIPPREKDERTRAIAARYGLVLLELWECEKREWPDQIVAWLDKQKLSTDAHS